MMKLLAQAVLISMSLIASLQAAEPGKHLFILSGQSNMVGMDPEQSFTPALRREFGAENVVVVKSAFSGSPIRCWYRQWQPAKDWKPQTPQEKWPENKPDFWTPLVKSIHGAVGEQKIQSVTFVWMQGESDALQRHGAVYGQSLLGLVGQLQAELKRPDIHVVIGRISDFGVSRNMPHWMMVREAQVQFAQSNPLYGWVDTDDLNDGIQREGRAVPNDLHYSPQGYRILGERFAAKAVTLLKLVNKQ